MVKCHIFSVFQATCVCPFALLAGPGPVLITSTAKKSRSRSGPISLVVIASIQRIETHSRHSGESTRWNQGQHLFSQQRSSPFESISGSFFLCGYGNRLEAC
ncbi:hypothetical protein BV22DRAFT_118210 [Leucogyrophana mollusca]|uniref:Uncharacterized protein n=1 Tax=Leucogyrophana mollusca TaxID=85980 RepID=A0ACB8BYF0_9AGAM|nr:hypothetical protein BV22DRAFT_118210 [Leucogyrophana mollusca]